MIANLLLKNGSQIEIWQVLPPYKLFEECTLCLTTFGTNTTKLAYLGVPMLVVHLGFSGVLQEILLLKVPGIIGDMAAYLMNFVRLKTFGFVSWPSWWAKEENHS